MTIIVDSKIHQAYVLKLKKFIL